MPRHYHSPSAVFLAMTTVFLTPSAALAYYPCDGAGPGEVIVGLAPNGPGQPETPLCEYIGEDGGGVGGGDPGGYWVEQHAALVWGQDANGDPTYSWYANAASQAEAEQGAFAQCQGAGDRNCLIANSVSNAAIAVAIDGNGGMYSDWGAKPGEAKRNALRFCRQEGGKSCKIDKVIDSPAVWVSN
jgi:hypothetical protein